jgi:hypothetical protein
MDQPEARSLGGRLIGVVTSPRATYAAVAATPRWVALLLVVLLASIAPTTVFLSTPVGRQALVDQQVRTFESFGRSATDQQYERLEQFAALAAPVTALVQVVVVPVAALMVAAIAFGIFSAALGGDATFRQVFAVVVASGVILAIRSLFDLPIDYARETLSNPASLSVFAPFLDESSFPARLLGSIDLFVVWWTVSLAIGLGVLYKRRTAPIAAWSLAAYGALAIVVAAIRTMLSGA